MPLGQNEVKTIHSEVEGSLKFLQRFKARYFHHHEAETIHRKPPHTRAVATFKVIETKIDDIEENLREIQTSLKAGTIKLGEVKASLERAIELRKEIHTALNIGLKSTLPEEETKLSSRCDMITQQLESYQTVLTGFQEKLSPLIQKYGEHAIVKSSGYDCLPGTHKTNEDPSYAEPGSHTHEYNTCERRIPEYQEIPPANQVENPIYDGVGSVADDQGPVYDQLGNSKATGEDSIYDKLNGTREHQYEETGHLRNKTGEDKADEDRAEHSSKP
jgi:hypothetical protein